MINLKETCGKRYKVVFNREWEPGRGSKLPFYEIHGKRGYIRPWGNDLELYLANVIVANRIERINRHFKSKNHYDDAIAFVFKEEYLSEACKLVQAKNRRQMTPEALERLSRMRSLIKKPLVASVSGPLIPEQ